MFVGMGEGVASSQAGAKGLPALPTRTHTLPCPYHWPSTMGCSSCSRVCLLPQQLLELMVYSCP